MRNKYGMAVGLEFTQFCWGIFSLEMVLCRSEISFWRGKGNFNFTKTFVGDSENLWGSFEGALVPRPVQCGPFAIPGLSVVLALYST